MFKKLTSRLWLTYALLSGFILFILFSGFLIYLIRNPESSRQLYNQLQYIASLIKFGDRITNGVISERIIQAVQNADVNYNVRLILIDSQRNVILDSRKDSAGDLPLRLYRPLLTILNSNLSHQFKDSTGQTWLFATRLLENNYSLIVAAPKPPLDFRTIFQDDLLVPFSQMAIIAILLSMLLAIYISRWIAKPLKEISEAAQKSTIKEINSLNVEGPEETVLLADAIKNMVIRMNASQRSQREFIANVSHDLKTPLTSIQGYAQAILDGTASNSEEVHKAGQIIKDEADRMNRMVIDLLELARLESGITEMRMSPIHFEELITGLINRFSPLISAKEIEIYMNVPQLPTFIGDNDYLTRAFGNLLDNAVKHTPNKGTIQFKADADGGSLSIIIFNSGNGIPDEDLPKIFDRFYQTDKTRSGKERGTGLGLAIAREIILSHRGSISVVNNLQTKYPTSSTKYEGCTFTVKLPLDPTSNSIFSDTET